MKATPADKLDAVVRHEWSHVMSFRDYRTIAAAQAALSHTFGSIEVAADCMALQLGANWTNYSACTAPGLRAAADRLLKGAPA